MTDAALYIQLLLLTGILVVITLVDFRTRTIPDLATLCLAVVGLGFQWFYASPISALISASVYFVLFWAVRETHRRLTNRIGMGFGDVKMAGAAGFWLSIGAVPLFVAIAAGTALVSVLAASAIGGVAILRQRIPFGPFLALSLLVCWMLKISDVEMDALYGL